MKDLREMTGYVNTLARGFMDSQVLFAANEADVFAHLDESRTAEEVAAATGWELRATRMLLEGLVAIGLAEKSGEWYHNTPVASECLVPGRPGYQGNIVKHIENTVAGWRRLPEALRTGKSVQEDHAQRPPQELRNFILGMNDIAQMSAREVLQAVDLSAHSHLLDVGGGPGTYCITFLQAHPNMKATLFDMPPVIAIAREQVERAGLGSRITFRPGDLTVDAWGSGYDLVFVSNIIHSFGPEKNMALVRSAFNALEPGGLFIIKDFLTDNDRTGPAYSLLFALHMLIATGEGDTYSFAQVEGWTRDAGFEAGRAIDLTPQSRLWLAKKPYPKARSSFIGFLDKTPPSKLPHGDFSTE